MFGHIYEWMRDIAYYMVLVTAALHIVPNRSYGRYVRLFTRLVLVLMIAAPLLELFGADIRPEELAGGAAYYEEWAEEFEKKGYEGAEERIVTESGMKEETEAAEDTEEIGSVRVEEIRIE